MPVIAFKEAFKHAPLKVGDNSWRWSYDFKGPYGIITYTAGLTGTRMDGGVNWSMVISNPFMKDFEIPVSFYFDKPINNGDLKN